MKNLTIRIETEKDYRAVENLTREAFWNVYKPGCDEHYFVHMLRSHEDFVPDLSFVIEKAGEIIGSIIYTKAKLISDDGETKEILSFGPICVLPEYQRQGLSRLLIEYSFEKAKELGYDTVVILGNPANYVGRGFVSCKKKNICLMEGVFPTALLVKELVPNALDGRQWQFIPSSAEDCVSDTEAAAAFEATFPAKEKAWRPSQEEFYIYSHSCIVR